MGGFNLTYDSFIYIESIAKLLNSNNDLQLIVAGHTDNIGDNNSNLLLSKKRAEKVREALLTLGVDNEQIKLEYYGEELPIDSNEKFSLFKTQNAGYFNDEKHLAKIIQV